MLLWIFSSNYILVYLNIWKSIWQKKKTLHLIIYLLSLKSWLTSQLQLYLFIYILTDLRGQRIVHLYPTVTSKIIASLVVSSVNQKVIWKILHSIQFSSVAQSCPTLCDPMNLSTPGLPVHHPLPEFAQTHVHRVGDAIQPCHPLSSPSPAAPNPSQHQSLFQRVTLRVRWL